MSDRVLLLALLAAVLLYRLASGLVAFHRHEMARLEGLLAKSEAERQRLLVHMAQSEIFGQPGSAPAQAAGVSEPEGVAEEISVEDWEQQVADMTARLRPQSLGRVAQKIQRNRDYREFYDRRNPKIASVLGEFEQAAEQVKTRNAANS
jgi:hypothetical protein